MRIVVVTVVVDENSSLNDVDGLTITINTALAVWYLAGSSTGRSFIFYLSVLAQEDPFQLEVHPAKFKFITYFPSLLLWQEFD